MISRLIVAVGQAMISRLIVAVLEALRAYRDAKRRPWPRMPGDGSK